MKILKGLIVLYSLLLFVIPISFAEIDITMQEKDTYNLGEKVTATVSVKEDQDYNGFFTMRLLCDDYNLQYYASPLSLEEGVRTQVEVPELTLFSSMRGTCRIKAGFDAANGEKISTSSSNDFLVTDKISITIDENLEGKPGEELVIVADVKKQSNEILSEGEAEIQFMNSKQDVNVSMGKLEYTYKLDYDVEGNILPLKIIVRDKYDNYGEKDIHVKVTQIPARIENTIENEMLIPGDDFKAKVTLYDHNSNIIEGIVVSIRVFGPEENLIIEDEIKSMESFGFTTNKDLEPGVYTLLSEHKDIQEQSTFTIETIRKIAMSQEGNIVTIENVGNVEYNDETTIILESDGKNYLVNEKIELKPGETTTIDLSKEVPKGIYDITLPEDAVEEDNETTAEIFGPANLIEGVEIEDNRNIAKKTVSGIASISGAVVSTAGVIVSKPLLASTILATIILGIVTYYGRGFVTEKIKGRKPQEETSELFKDFDYEKKE